VGFLFGKGAAFFVYDLERYEPYLLLALAGLTACMWLSHFVAQRWRRRTARARLTRMKLHRAEVRSRMKKELPHAGGPGTRHRH
jgi:hypothetical protein